MEGGEIGVLRRARAEQRERDANVGGGPIGWIGDDELGLDGGADHVEARTGGPQLEHEAGRFTWRGNGTRRGRRWRGGCGLGACGFAVEKLRTGLRCLGSNRAWVLFRDRTAAEPEQGGRSEDHGRSGGGGDPEG